LNGFPAFVESQDDLRRERDDWKEQAQRLALAAPIATPEATAPITGARQRPSRADHASAIGSAGRLRAEGVTAAPNGGVKTLGRDRVALHLPSFGRGCT
jgi:hypothetical protein